MKEKLTQILGYPILFICEVSGDLCDANTPCDYIVVVEDWNKKYEKITVDNSRCYCFAVDYFEKWATMQLDARMEMFTVALFYGKTLFGENPILGYDWYSFANANVKSILKHCKSILNGIVFGGIVDGKRVCSKVVRYPLLAYFAKINGNNILNQDQQRLLELCKQGKLSIDVAKDLHARLYRIAEQSL